VPSPRRFPPPWAAEETDACFIVRDSNGQALSYVYFEDQPGRRAAAKQLTRDEARRMAANFAPSCRSCCAGRRDKRGVTRLQPPFTTVRTMSALDPKSGSIAATHYLTSWATTRHVIANRPLYSITLSARVRKDSGMVSPSALAVFRLTTRSNFAGSSTGMSSGLTPRRTLTIRRANCR
jgi:hypothetical protein